MLLYTVGPPSLLNFPEDFQNSDRSSVIEEIPNPAVEGPKIMIACVGIGIFTGFIFLMVLLFVAGQVDGPDGVSTYFLEHYILHQRFRE